jgi:hypothetical protein
VATSYTPQIKSTSSGVRSSSQYAV